MGGGRGVYNTDTKVYWVSFLNGMQRILLFTHDLALATILQEVNTSTLILMICFLFLRIKSELVVALTLYMCMTCVLPLQYRENANVFLWKF